MICSSGATKGACPLTWFSSHDCVVGVNDGGGVFGLDGKSRLRPTHFEKSIADGYHVLGTIEEAGKFGFGGRRSDEFDDLRYGEDWSVDMGVRGAFGEEYVVTGADARADDVKVRGVSVVREYHVDFVVDNAVVRVGSDV